MKSFKEWLSIKDNYTKLYKSLYSSVGFEKYRHISQAELLDSLSTHVFNSPRQVMVPKDAFSEREVFLYETKDNLLLKFYNAYLNECFKDDISDCVYSYQEGVSVSRALSDFYRKYKEKKCHIKIDLSNYFMTPSGELLENFLRKYGLLEKPFNKLFNNVYYENGTNQLKTKNLGLLPGAPISAFLSNAYLLDFDNHMSANYDTYVRYCDDFIISCEEWEVTDAVADVTNKLNSLGLIVNEKKTKIYKPGDVITFLGSDIYPDGYQINEKRLKKIKSTIKKIAIESSKLKVTPDARIGKFLHKVYKYMFKDITNDLYRGGVCSSWFSCTTLIERLQIVDFYILDKCRFVYSGKTNFGALRAGVNTEYLENLGFKSLVLMWKMYKANPLIMAFEAFRLINSFTVSKSDDWVLYKPKNIHGKFDFMQLLFNSKAFEIDISKWNINPYEKIITLGGVTLFDEEVNAFYPCDSCTISMEDNYGTITAEEFFDVFKLTSYKSVSSGTTRTKLFNPVPHYKLPYYSYLDVPKSDAVQMAAGLLFLHNTGRLVIQFEKTDASNKYVTQRCDGLSFVSNI